MVGLAACSLLAAASGADGQTPDPGPADTVFVTLEDGRATVELRIPSATGVVEGHAIRVVGQALSLTEVAVPAGPIEHTLIDEPGAFRIVVASTAAVTVRYHLEGELSRIPLFVPGGGAEVTISRDEAEPYLIRISGPPDELASIDTDTSMPRFVRAGDRVLEARLSSVPAFLRLSGGGPRSFARIADALALFLIVVGGIVAYRRLSAAARAVAPGD